MADKSDRLEREINEILNKIERFPTPEERRRRAVRRSFREFGSRIAEKQRTLARSLSRISLSQLMLLSFILILGSFFLGSALPFARSWLMLAGVALFVASFALLLFSGGRGGGAPASNQRRWRGRTIEYRREGFGDRLRRLFRGRRGS